MRTAGSTWVLFDYGGVICTDQPDEDVVALAAAAGVGVPEFRDAYWAYRLSYDRAELDGPTYWQKVAAALGRSFPARQTAELTRLDIASWLHLQEGTVALIEELAAAGHPLALLSNAPAGGPPLRALCVQLLPRLVQARARLLPGRAGHAWCPPGRRDLLRRPSGERRRGHRTGHPRCAIHHTRGGAGRPDRARHGRLAAWLSKEPAAAGRLCHDEPVTTLGVRHFVSNVTHPY